jgi:serine/threonine protein phosphatase PrpC
MHQAHIAIHHYTLEHQLKDSPRTTGVACVIQNDVAHWAHVGDSRLYHYRGALLCARTRDHSRVQQLYEQGAISEVEMLTHPDRNKIFNCLGGRYTPEVEVSPPVVMQEGDLVLLCTDGVWAPLSVNEVGAILGAFPLHQGLEELLDHAELRAGPGGDNLSAIVAAWGDARQAASAGVSTAMMSLGNVTTHLDAFQAEGASEMDIEQAIAEIKSAIEKYSGNS